MRIFFASTIFLFLGFGGTPRSLEGSQSATEVDVNCLIRLDHPEGFSWNSLQVKAVFGQEEDETKGEAVVIDSTGRLTVQSPRGKQLRLLISTKDPTVRAISRNSLSWYAFEERKLNSLGEKKIEIALDAGDHVDVEINLQRGAAVRYCLGPVHNKAGQQLNLISFRRWSADEGEIGALVSLEHVKHGIIGGLEPGRWVIEQRDGRQVVWSRTANLGAGEFPNIPCTEGR